MASIIKERHINVTAQAAWEALRDWAGLRERLVPGFVTDIHLDGDDRILTFYNGLTVRERQVGILETHRRLVWTIADPEGPFDHYNGAAQVVEQRDGVRFVWTADVLPDEMAPQVETMIDHGLDVIKRTLESTVPKGVSVHSD